MKYDKQARAAFVALIKEENFDRDTGKWSLRQHWAGPEHGFADEMLQVRYKFFTLGWSACKSAPAATEELP